MNASRRPPLPAVARLTVPLLAVVLLGACAGGGGDDDEREASGPSPRLTTTTTAGPPAAVAASPGGPGAPAGAAGGGGAAVGTGASGCPGGWPDAQARSMEWQPSQDIEGRFEVRIEGDVTNVTAHPVRINSIELLIRTEEGEEMTTVTSFPVDAEGRSHQPVLAPGGVTPFLWGDYIYWDERHPGEHPDTVQIVDLNWRWDEPFSTCPAG